MSFEDIAVTAYVTESENPTAIQLVASDALEEFLAGLDQGQRSSLERQGFRAGTDQFAWLEDGDGARVLVGWDGADSLATLGALPMSLPEGEYQIVTEVSDLQLLGWGM